MFLLVRDKRELPSVSTNSLLILLHVVLFQPVYGHNEMNQCGDRSYYQLINSLILKVGVVWFLWFIFLLLSAHLLIMLFNVILFRFPTV